MYVLYVLIQLLKGVSKIRYVRRHCFQMAKGDVFQIHSSAAMFANPPVIYKSGFKHSECIYILIYIIFYILLCTYNAYLPI